MDFLGFWECLLVLLEDSEAPCLAFCSRGLTLTLCENLCCWLSEGHLLAPGDVRKRSLQAGPFREAACSNLSSLWHIHLLCHFWLGMAEAITLTTEWKSAPRSAQLAWQPSTRHTRPQCLSFDGQEDLVRMLICWIYSSKAI